MMQESPNSGAHELVAFALVYLTFFLDNVLLTVLVPIIPDWVRGEALALWAARDAPLAALLNETVRAVSHHAEGVGGSQAAVGAVLGAKAAAQLAAAPAAAGAVCTRGAAPVLRAGTALLTTAALVFAACSESGGATGAAWCAGAGRAAHGAGAALAGVAGLALAAGLPPDLNRRAIAALLGAVALGVLVGYPFGGAAYAMWSRSAPFLIIALALLVDLAMQYMFLDREEYYRTCVPASPEESRRSTAMRGWRAWCGDGGLERAARRGAAAACAGTVLLTTSVMAALEPCLPLWIDDKFHPQRWQTGVVFVPDSAAYLLATSVLGGAARRLGAERVALAGQVTVGLAALAIPHATSVGWLVLPHAALGCGLGAADAALAPALLARAPPSAAPHVAALLHAAASAAYALGPIVGGVVSWCVGFETALRALAVVNLLYAGHLYRALARRPLSEQWGASSERDDSSDEGEELAPLQPLQPLQYTTLQ